MVGHRRCPVQTPSQRFPAGSRPAMKRVPTLQPPRLAGPRQVCLDDRTVFASAPSRLIARM
jgi:hypothetical protein